MPRESGASSIHRRIVITGSPACAGDDNARYVIAGLVRRAAQAMSKPIESHNTGAEQPAADPVRVAQAAPKRRLVCPPAFAPPPY